MAETPTGTDPNLLRVVNESLDAQSRRLDELGKLLANLENLQTAQTKEVRATMAAAREWLNTSDERLENVGTLIESATVLEANLTVTVDRLSALVQELRARAR